MKGAMAILKPMLTETGVEPIGKISIGTIKGDLHDIGKNLVCMMLEGGGFEVIDLGVDVSPEKFVDSIKEKGVQVIGMSALLTTTMINMREMMKLLDETNLRNKVKVMIGGAPVTDSYAKEIGADAATAVEVVKSLL